MTNAASLPFQFIPLTFVRRHEEIQNIIKNTMIMKSIYQRFHEIRPLGELLSSTQYGYTASAKEMGNCRFLRITDLKETGVNWNTVPYCECDATEKYILKKHDILIARTGGTTGKSFLVDNVPEVSVFASYLIRLSVSEVENPFYVYMFLNSFVFWAQIMQMKGGSAQPNVNARKMATIEVPYCPLAIQNDIVTTFIKGKPSTDIYIRDISGSIRKTLHKQESIKELQGQTRVQKTFFEQLRQAILQEAVQGKLTEAWRQAHPDIEPASELLKRIQAEKAQLIKEKKIKKQKPLPPIKDDEIPFKLPEGWAWCRIDDLVATNDNSIRRGPFGSSITKDMFVPKSKNTYKIYEQGNVIKKDYSLGDYYIDEAKFNELRRFSVEPGDILISCAGTIGETYLLPEGIPPGIINQALLKIRLNEQILDSYYFLYLFQSLIRMRLNSDAKGSAMKNMGSIKYIKEFVLFPIPPVHEQKSIVVKINRFMTYCDQFEQQIIKSQNIAEQLMQAVLREAFTTS